MQARQERDSLTGEQNQVLTRWNGQLRFCESKMTEQCLWDRNYNERRSFANIGSCKFAFVTHEKFKNWTLADLAMGASWMSNSSPNVIVGTVGQKTSKCYVIRSLEDAYMLVETVGLVPWIPCRKTPIATCLRSIRASCCCRSVLEKTAALEYR